MVICLRCRVPSCICGEKICSRCYRLQPLIEYHRQGNGTDKRRACCRTCVNALYRRSKEERRAYASQWRAAHVEEYRRYQREYHRVWDRLHREQRRAAAQRSDQQRVPEPAYQGDNEWNME